MADMVSGFQNAIDTFAIQPITIWQAPQQTYIATDPNWNPFSQPQQNVTGDVQVTQIMNLISGRVLYDKQQEWGFVRPYVGRGPNEGQLKIKDQTTRSVRIKVDATGYALLSKAPKEVDIDGFAFFLESVARPHGLFLPNQYTFYFTRKL